MKLKVQNSFARLDPLIVKMLCNDTSLEEKSPSSGPKKIFKAKHLVRLGKTRPPPGRLESSGREGEGPPELQKKKHL
jgi:hypothetical protein